MHLTQEAPLNDKEFLITLGLLITGVIIILIVLICIFIIKPRLTLNKLGRYQQFPRSNKRYSIAITPRLSMIQTTTSTPLPRIHIPQITDASLSKDITLPPKRYTPYSFDLSRISVLDVAGNDSVKYKNIQSGLN